MIVIYLINSKCVLDEDEKDFHFAYDKENRELICESLTTKICAKILRAIGLNVRCSKHRCLRFKLNKELDTWLRLKMVGGVVKFDYPEEKCK